MSNGANANRADEWARVVKSHGFAFQERLRSDVAASASKHGYRETGREIGVPIEGGKTYFVDLELERGFVTMVVEAKRAKSGSWIFLIPDEQSVDPADRTIYLKACYEEPGVLASTCAVRLGKALPRSAYCISHKDEGDTRLFLEGICRDLLACCQARAEERDQWIRGANGKRGQIFVPVVVTTASLVAARFDPKDVGLESGDIAANKIRFEPSAAVIFQKSFPVGGLEALEMRGGEIHRPPTEHSVLVVHAPEFVEFLRSTKFARSMEHPGWMA